MEDVAVAGQRDAADGAGALDGENRHGWIWMRRPEPSMEKTRRSV